MIFTRQREIRRYLLGLMPPAVEEHFEETILVMLTPKELSRARDTLARDYARNRMTGEEQAAYRERLAADEDLRRVGRFRAESGHSIWTWLPAPLVAATLGVFLFVRLPQPPSLETASLPSALDQPIPTELLTPKQASLPPGSPAESPAEKLVDLPAGETRPVPLATPPAAQTPTPPDLSTKDLLPEPLPPAALAPPSVPPADLPARALAAAESPAWVRHEIAQFRRETKIAVLAAVDLYQGPLAPLRHSVASARALGAELQRQGYDVHLLLNEHATKHDVTRVLRAAASQVDSERGVLLFSFAGHGYSHNGENRLATYGANPMNPSEAGLAVAELRRSLDASRARSRMMWIDVGQETDGAGLTAAGRSFRPSETAVLYSSSSSPEDTASGRRVFSRFLWEALRGAAAEEHGLMTFRGLARFVVRRSAAHERTSNTQQRVFVSADGIRDFLVAVPPDEASSSSRTATGTFTMTREETGTTFAVSVREDGALVIRANNLSLEAVLRREPETAETDLYTGTGRGGETIEVTSYRSGSAIRLLTGRIRRPPQADSSSKGGSKRGNALDDPWQPFTLALRRDR